MSNFFDFFTTNPKGADKPPAFEDDWQPATHRPSLELRVPRAPRPVPPRTTAEVIPVAPKPQPAPVRYGDPPAKLLHAA